jgi:hypothetical protein
VSERANVRAYACVACVRVGGVCDDVCVCVCEWVGVTMCVRVERGGGGRDCDVRVSIAPTHPPA